MKRASQSRADDYVGRTIAFLQGSYDIPLRRTQRDDVLPGLRVIGFEQRITIAFVVTDVSKLSVLALSHN
ncbi:MAG: hypothetical protein ACLQU2_03685 [Candidatus Binataceae bacterium]